VSCLTAKFNKEIILDHFLKSFFSLGIQLCNHENLDRQGSRTGLGFVRILIPVSCCVPRSRSKEGTDRIIVDNLDQASHLQHLKLTHSQSVNHTSGFQVNRLLVSLMTRPESGRV
jgi:hypothetical protein